jgi:putative transposase
MDWTRILAYIAGSVDQELPLRNEYLAAENRILRAQLNGCLRLSDAERATLGQIGFRRGRKALSKVATVVQPDTILAWHRRLIARKFEGSRARRVRGRPRIDREVEGLIIRMAEENRSWGYDRIVGALANLGHGVSDQTVGNVLRRHGISPAPERKRRTCLCSKTYSITECGHPRPRRSAMLCPFSQSGHHRDRRDREPRS